MEANSISINKLNSAVLESPHNGVHVRHDVERTISHTSFNGTPKIKKVDQSVQADVYHEEHDKNQAVTISQLILDKANLCTFTGTILATMALANVWKGRYFLGLTMSTLASLADILDGPIARSNRLHRPTEVCTVGKYLDTYSDVISHFVVPASLLMELSDLNPVCLMLAALFVCTGVLRHACHEIVDRLDDGSCSYGVTSDYLVSTFVIVMHLALVVDTQILVVIISIVMVLSIFVSLSEVFRSRRYSGMNLAIVGVYHLWLALSCMLLRYFSLSEKEGSFWISEEQYKDAMVGGNHFYGFTLNQMATGFLAINFGLAYPCYYRFIERNV